MYGVDGIGWRALVRRFSWIVPACALSAAAAFASPDPQPSLPGIIGASGATQPASLPGSFATPAFPAAQGRLVLPGVKRFQRGDCDAAGLAKRVRDMQVGPLHLDLGAGQHWDLDLQRISARAPGYRVRVRDDNGIHEVAPQEELAFRGRVRGLTGSRVRLAFSDGHVTGFIDNGDGNRTYIEPLDRFDARLPPSAHALYRHADLELTNGTPLCGWRPESQLQDMQRILPPAPSPVLPKSIFGPGTLPAFGKSSAVGESGAGAVAAAAIAAEPCALVEIGVAADYSMVKGYGSAAKVEKRINDIFVLVEGLYEDPRLNINIKITELFIEASEKKTWGEMNINSYLTNITSWARGANGFKNSYDVADLWYFDPLVSTSTTGLANVGTVCNKTSGGHVIRDFTPTASYLMINQAHELGHNFGANHVNNATAILNPMILGDNVSWDDVTIDAILDHKHTRTCLSSCEKGPTADFAIQASTPCSETRDFVDASTGDPIAWTWEFGDGQSSKVQNPSHTYAAAGMYTAKLTATNTAGSNSLTKGNIKVKPFASPEATGARSCTPGPLTLKATGSGTIKWYDQQQGGNKVGEGTSFQTPSLSQTRIYYAENGDPALAISKLGPAANTIGAGNAFAANSDRRMYFDVNRSAILKTAKVYATGAGARTVEILDQNDKRVAARTVQVPDGESRITLDIELEPGHDYAIKYAGSPDSLNLFRNSAGAKFPYRTKDSLIAITHSDAVTSDSTSQTGYYYFFYDWEVQERGCGSIRVPVAAEISCVPISDRVAGGAAVLRMSGPGRWTLQGTAPADQEIEFRLRRLDGGELRRQVSRVRAGAFAVEVDLAGLPANLYLVEVHQAGVRILRRLIGS